MRPGGQSILQVTCADAVRLPALEYCFLLYTHYKNDQNRYLLRHRVRSAFLLSPSSSARTQVCIFPQPSPHPEANARAPPPISHGHIMPRPRVGGCQRWKMLFPHPLPHPGSFTPPPRLLVETRGDGVGFGARGSNLQSRSPRVPCGRSLPFRLSRRFPTNASSSRLPQRAPTATFSPPPRLTSLYLHRSSFPPASASPPLPRARPPARTTTSPGRPAGARARRTPRAR